MRKHCPGCNQDLPIDQFHRNKARYDGRASHCRTCKNAQTRYKPEKYDASKPRILEYTKQWRVRNPDKLKAQRQRYYEAAKEKRAAHQAVYRALLKGTLVAQPRQ
jgi:hypothetical protein